MDNVDLVAEGLYLEVEEAWAGDVLQVPVAQDLQLGLVVNRHVEVGSTQGEVLGLLQVPEGKHGD